MCILRAECMQPIPQLKEPQIRGKIFPVGSTPGCELGMFLAGAILPVHMCQPVCGRRLDILIRAQAHAVAAPLGQTPGNPYAACCRGPTPGSFDVNRIMMAVCGDR